MKILLMILLRFVETSRPVSHVLDFVNAPTPTAHPPNLVASSSAPRNLLVSALYDSPDFPERGVQTTMHVQTIFQDLRDCGLPTATDPYLEFAPAKLSSDTSEDELVADAFPPLPPPPLSIAGTKVALKRRSDKKHPDLVLSEAKANEISKMADLAQCLCPDSRANRRCKADQFLDLSANLFKEFSELFFGIAISTLKKRARGPSVSFCNGCHTVNPVSLTRRAWLSR